MVPGRDTYRRLDAWLRAHWRVHLLLLAVVPGTVVAATSVVLSGDDVETAVLMGATFGLVYAAITYFWGTLRDDE